MPNVVSETATAARNAGLYVGLVHGKEADEYFRIQDRGQYGHAHAMSIYRDEQGNEEVARLVWSYVSPDRLRFGWALSFAGIRDGDRFVDQHEVRKVRAALGF